MDAHIFPDVADIAPDAAIEHHTGDFFPGTEGVEPDGNKRQGLAGRDAREQRGVCHANAGVEKTRRGGTEFAADVRDQTGRRIEADLERSARGAKRQRAKCSAFGMRGKKRGQIKFGQDIAVVNEHGTRQQQVLDIFQSARRFKQHRLVAEEHGNAVELRRTGIFGEQPDEFVGQAMRVDHDALDTGGRDARQGELAERHAADRNERFGNLVGQRLEALAPTGTKKERGADRRAHAVPPGEISRRMVSISDATKP